MPGVTGVMAVKVALESPDQPAVRALIAAADAHHAALYPAESHRFIDVAALGRPEVAFAVARDDRGEAIGCGAAVMRGGFAEIKRMFVTPSLRGAGCGRALLACVEAAAVARGHRLLRLETGIRQPEAIALYERAGYRRRDAVENATPDPTSLLMEKTISC